MGSKITTIPDDSNSYWLCQRQHTHPVLKFFTAPDDIAINRNNHIIHSQTTLKSRTFWFKLGNQSANISLQAKLLYLLWIDTCRH